MLDEGKAFSLSCDFSPLVSWAQKLYGWFPKCITVCHGGPISLNCPLSMVSGEHWVCSLPCSVLHSSVVCRLQVSKRSLANVSVWKGFLGDSDWNPALVHLGWETSPSSRNDNLNKTQSLNLCNVKLGGECDGPDDHRDIFWRLVKHNGWLRPCENG